jgi:hypothetical protein
MESKAPKKKPYSPPTLAKLTPEQAKKLVADRRNYSEEEADDLLEMPPDNGNQNTATESKGETLSLDAEISRRTGEPIRKKASCVELG